jgi:amino acid transporter
VNAQVHGDDAEDRYLQEIGIQPRLRRGISAVEQGLFGIAFQGPTAGSILVTSAAFAVAGPSFIWIFPIMLVFQLVLALVWGEMVSQYPVTGGMYQWATRLGNRWWGWLTAVCFAASIVVIEAVLGVIVNVILNGLFPSIAFNEKNHVIISIALTCLAGLVISRSVRLSGLINGLGVFMELFVLFGMSIVLLFHVRQPVHVVLHTGQPHGSGSYFVPFTIAIALEMTLLTGFETAGFFAEEVRGSRRAGPRAIITACAGTVVFTGLFAFTMLLATPNISQAMASSADWVPTVLHAALGNVGEKIFLVAALIALISTAIASLGAVSRLLYAMGRSGYLPGGASLTRISPRTGIPTTAVMTAVILSFLPLIIINQVTVVIDAITGLLLVTYLITLGAAIYRRMRGWPTERSPFSLGRAGLPLTVVGFVWVVFVLVLAAWPRDVTNPKLGVTRVFWEVLIVLFAIAVIGWFAKVRTAKGTEDALMAGDAK